MLEMARFTGLVQNSSGQVDFCSSVTISLTLLSRDLLTSRLTSNQRYNGQQITVSKNLFLKHMTVPDFVCVCGRGGWGGNQYNISFGKRG